MENNHIGYKDLNQNDYELILDAIFTQSKDGIFVTDNFGRVITFNKASEDMLGVSLNEAIGKNVKDLVEKGYYDRSVALLAIEKKRPVTIIQRTFNNRRILTTGIPIFRDNHLRFVLVNDRDISSLSSYVNFLDDEVCENHEFQLSDSSLLSAELNDVVIKSPIMQDVVRKIEKASKTDCPVLLQGETGVGKSLFARLIHDLSTRKNKQFMELNCGAIAENLLETELFGYEKGAFTGAHPSGKCGIIESTHNGTLFMDEINSISFSQQVKILKFLDTKEIRKVGSTRNLPVDVRIITATNTDLPHLVDDRLFREDLYFRISVIPIYIPPLRERIEEVDYLIDYFINKINKNYSMNKTLSSSAKFFLISYDYPGNIRELENIIKQILILSDNDYITKNDLPDYITNKNILPQETDDSSIRSQYKNAVNKYEISYLQEVIEKCGSQRKASEILGISQATISRKLSQRSDDKHLIHD